MRFTLKQLGYFVAVGETGSILKASQNIHVSQPSISSAISQLEDTFDLQLFIRHHAQGLSLTSAGQRFFVEAKDVLSRAARLHGVAGELANKLVGTLEVGCFNPLAPIVIPSLCHGFMAEAPGVDVRVREAHQADLLQFLRRGSIDMALTYDLQVQRDIEFIPLASLPPYALVSANHPLAGQSEVELSALIDEPMILLDLPLSSEYFMSLFHASGLKPVIKARTSQSDVQRGLVASGYGYSLANARPNNQAALDGNSIHYLRLSGSHQPLTLGIASLLSRRSNQLEQRFTTYCQTTIRDDAIPGMCPLP